MDEPHFLACLRYVENNPVRAKLVKQPEEWSWSSASAHIKAKNDILVNVSPALSIVQDDWKQFLSKTNSFEQMETFRIHERTGRPIGSDSFVQKLEQKLHRILRPQKPGRKAKSK
jgi:putative transposase